MNTAPAPENPVCCGFISASDGRAYGPVSKDENPDCSSCVYFSKRNCGRDSGPDYFVFDQPFI
jgi:hypothetical protein